jgi:hypothetical protein
MNLTSEHCRERPLLLARPRARTISRPAQSDQEMSRKKQWQDKPDDYVLATGERHSVPPCRQARLSRGMPGWWALR